jgi:hypothetical protein
VTVTHGPGPRRLAGEPVPLTVSVENQGPGAFQRLRGWALVQQCGPRERHEFVLGTIPPRQRRSWTVPLPTSSSDGRHCEVTVHFDEEHGRAPADVAIDFEVAEPPRPVFAVGARLEGDVEIGPSQDVRLRLDVRNLGEGPSGSQTYVSLRSLDPDGVDLKQGRAVLGALPPGGAQSAVLTFHTSPALRKAPRLRVDVADRESEEFTSTMVDLSGALRAPPRIDLPPSSPAIPVVEADRWTITGTANARLVEGGGARLRDLMIFANDRKILYAAAADEHGADTLSFSAEVPLRMGETVITIIARADDEQVGHRTIHIYRTIPALPLKGSRP